MFYATCCMSYIVCHILHVVQNMSYIAMISYIVYHNVFCLFLYVICCVSRFTLMSHVVCGNVTCRMLYVVCHTLQ